MAIVEAAISMDQSDVNCCTNNCKPTVIVAISLFLTNILANVYSFHAFINVNIPTVATPGSDVGSIIR